MENCLYCERPVKGTTIDCDVCEDGPYCSNYRIQCPCKKLPVHYLCLLKGYNGKLIPRHECMYYDDDEDSEGCATPVCKTNTIILPMCVIDSDNKRRFCDKHFPVAKQKDDRYGYGFKRAKRKEKKNLKKKRKFIVLSCLFPRSWTSYQIQPLVA